ncbi:DUF1641 domain-containing protein [Desulforhopalus sp. IMCC35007]|uniref:DUF1641 domain-containing protein n=1 Tax=Desulforhopalus sp. IMCC35007 TaxID=2569543 RepID=UPI0010AE13F9|nr:DUF1641 domain-containing protein [Desulforhopalus sp. IMCC35007]TKB06091.1 DUF1641 domain-containing protein [Desulforhopalus sp. IMCC35007]
MTNEEKILARLDELTAEIREAKQAIRPYVELKRDLEPLINDMVVSTIGKLSGLDRRFDLEDIGDMIGQLLISSKNMAEALKTLNKFMEFKKDFEPYSKDLFKELSEQLQTSLHGFEPENLQELIRQFIVNMGNMAEGLKMLGSLMDMKKDAGNLSKLAFNDSIERLERLKQRGTFETFEQVLEMTERVGSRMQQVDFEKIEPIRGIWGMMSAMKRPEVQEGLGILVELSTVMTALKQEPVPR